MRLCFLLVGAGLVAALLSCDGGGGGGKITAYCSAWCEWNDECTEWFDDEWDDMGDCTGECRSDTIDNLGTNPCRGQWLDFYTCYYAESADDCYGVDAYEECDSQWDRLEDCWDEHDQYYYYGDQS